MPYNSDIRASSQPRITRRTMIASALAFSTFATVVPALAQTSTPTSQAEGDADALDVLRSAGTAVLALETFTFSMTTTNGSSTIFPGVELISVEGEVRRPMDVSATLSVKAFTQTMTASAVVVDGDVYVQNPLSGGAWESMGSAPQIATMINPDWLLLASINLIKEAKITGERDGVTLVEGYVNLFDTIGELNGQETDVQDMQGLEQFLATGPVDVAFWIDEDNLINRAELYGPIFANESPDVEKRIDLAGFDEPVEIEVPEIPTN